MRPLPSTTESSPEFLLDKGQIDRIVSRDDLRAELARMVAYATDGNPVAAFRAGAGANGGTETETADAVATLAPEKDGAEGKDADAAEAAESKPKARRKRRRKSES